MPEPILQIEKLWKRFGGVCPAAGLNLSVQSGHLHAVIGPNGAGKSTLIKLIAGELTADAGRIAFQGMDIDGGAAHKRAHLGIARSFQITNLIKTFTALENVALAVQGQMPGRMKLWGAVSQDSGLNDIAQTYLDRVGLGARGGARAGHLSYGEQRRLEVAIALSMRPRLLLLDEPLAGIGSEEGEHMTELLASLKGAVTIVLIEHDMEAVFTLADRITVLVDGKDIAAGLPIEIRGDARVHDAYLGTTASAQRS
jgi:branched-chain amino acid transport system ATP-binding protein